MVEEGIGRPLGDTLCKEEGLNDDNDVKPSRLEGGGSNGEVRWWYQKQRGDQECEWWHTCPRGSGLD